jgi:hypothetical protein
MIETILDDALWYSLAMLVIMTLSFGIGLVIGMIWTAI